ncbi:DinB family protein [Novipirellula artificiosorum]|uniref:DinB superfamily protein n=1 Tax=Novipirellula artificiosorum TaxID=2528016 RepID=A0A5C6DY64_9BACT|nr:DinB family protein [Novipirellula artificiosorum]TWU40787.1 DinB superfamily protein [Novipirellula artificiosorum]
MNSPPPEPAANPQASAPSIADAAIMLRSAIGQIRFARDYTLELLENTPREFWYTIPAGLPTHVAWQVGHLTVSQYGLLMFRMRGRDPDDLDLIPGKFRKAYGRESTPNPNPSAQSTPDELLERLAKVHQQSLQVLAGLDPAVLLQPVDMPYAAFPFKLGAILFCPIHEGIHAGQLGVLRRAHGLPPVR